MTLGKEGAARSFHFMVAVWGERYRNYLVNLFLPSLLAPNNLALIRAEDGHRFFIATTSEDWQVIEHLPIIERLRCHAEPIWIKINHPAHDSTSTDDVARYTAVLQHMDASFRMLLEAAYHPSCYGSLLHPDTIISDGMIASMLKSAREGYHLLLCSALRQSEEGVLAHLRALGLLPHNSPLSASGQPLTIPPRLGAHLAVRYLHRDVSALEEGAPGQPFLAPYRYWRMPEERGILLHTFFGQPVCIDFSVISPDHTRCMDGGAFENVYISSNFRGSHAIRMVPDSDEFTVLSLTPQATAMHAMPEPLQQRQSSPRRNYGQLCSIRRSFEFYAVQSNDFVKGHIFRIPVRWHAQDLDSVWMNEERRVRHLLERALNDYRRSSSNDGREWGRPRLNWRTLLLDVAWVELPAKLRGLLFQFGLRFRAAVLGGKHNRAQ
jgi:hypothetical protein